MYCSGSAFFCGNAGCSDCCRSSPQSRADFLCGIYEFAQLSVSVLAGVGDFFMELEKSLASSPASSMLLAAFSMAVLFELRSRSMPLRTACALFNCICRLWVLRSFSPNDSAALARAERSVSIFCF